MDTKRKMPIIFTGTEQRLSGLQFPSSFFWTQAHLIAFYRCLKPTTNRIFHKPLVFSTSSNISCPDSWMGTNSAFSNSLCHCWLSLSFPNHTDILRHLGSGFVYEDWRKKGVDLFSLFPYCLSVICTSLSPACHHFL